MEPRLIINPRAGLGRPGRAPDAVAACLARHGLSCRVSETTGPGSATETARAAAEAGCPLVVAAGGDGTVHEVLNGLVGTEAALAILPLGTENICARALGIPMGLDAACAHAAHAGVQRVDVGEVGGRCFLTMAGIGLDAYVVRHVSPEFKRRFHTLAFFLTGLRAACTYRPAEMRLHLPGGDETLQAWGILLCNAPLYAWRVRVAPSACWDDGVLDVCAFVQRSRAGFLAAVLGSAACSRMLCRHWKAEAGRVSAPVGVPVQMDGELVTLPHLEFRALPGALRVRS